MSLYQSLEELKLYELDKDQEIFAQEYKPPPFSYHLPNGYTATYPTHPSAKDKQLIQMTNGLRKLVLCKDAKGQVGLKLSAINNGIFVSVVVKDSPAAIGGLRFGDQLLQINESFVAGMSVDKVYKILNKCPHNNIHMIIRNRPLERSINLYKDRAGRVGFQFKNGKINAIVKDSSAARNGVLTEHQLLEINRQNVVGMKDKHILEMISKIPVKITITVIPVSIYKHVIGKNVTP